MEARRFPELGERFFELGPQRVDALLSNYFEEQIKRGRLVKEDSALMADHYVALPTGGPLRWLVLGLKRKPTAEDVSSHIEAAVRIFLRA
jgi:TetR/AcrR family transcriptional repressor of mexJK operon